MSVALVGVLATLVAVLSLIGERPDDLRRESVVDAFTIVFQMFFMSAAAVVLLISYRYFREGGFYQGEYYFLLLTSFLGLSADAGLAGPADAVPRSRARLRPRVPDGRVPEVRRQGERGWPEVLPDRRPVDGGDALRDEPDLGLTGISSLAGSPALATVAAGRRRSRAQPSSSWWRGSRSRSARSRSSSGPRTRTRARRCRSRRSWRSPSKAAGSRDCFQLCSWPSSTVALLGAPVRGALARDHDPREPRRPPAAAGRPAARVLRHRPDRYILLPFALVRPTPRSTIRRSRRRSPTS